MLLKFRLPALFVAMLLSLLFTGEAVATKPSVPWRIAIEAVALGDDKAEVAVKISGDIDLQGLLAEVISTNTTLLQGNERWKLDIRSGETVVVKLVYLYEQYDGQQGVRKIPQWKLLVRGDGQYASMSRIAIARLVQDVDKKLTSPRSRVRSGAEEYPSR